MFYQSSRPTKFWSKTATECYLTYCGVNKDLATKLHDIARKCAQLKKQDEIDYHDREGIHAFTDVEGKAHKFDWIAPWLDKDLSLDGYIEAIMHILFLGVEESNFELVGKWLLPFLEQSKSSFRI